MSVYVDSARNKFGRMQMCHMMADSLEELHAMAEAIGLKREWFQNKGTPHYDVCQAKRAKAIELGAVVVDNRKIVELIQYWRARGNK